MASEEDINNQSRFNDLQRDSNELLTDYQAGIRESSEFVSILTTRTSQLVDTIKDTVGEKKKSTQADKDLISSITKINNLTKDFATPYTDAGKAIRDTNKATELHERLVKDVGVISNKLGKDRLNQAQEYLETEKKLGSLERTLAAERKTMTTQDQKSADKIVEAQRNKIEAERQYNKFVETSGINVQSLYAKMGAIKRLEEDQEVKRRAYQAALKTGTEQQIKDTQEEYKRSKARVTLYEDGLTTVEKTALARQRAKQQAQEQYNDEFKAGSEAAKRYSLNQKDADVQRDIVEEKQKQLDTDQKLYVEGEKAIKQSETGVKYLEEENKRVREIIGAQTLWNLSLGAAEGILKKIGLDNQVIVLGLDEGTKAAKEYAAELVAGRQKARGEAALTQQASEDASQALINAEQQLTDAKLNGSASQIQAAQKEYDERKKLSEQAKIDAVDAEAASKKANSLVTKIGDSFRVLGKGVSATFKGMASELKALGGIGIALALTKKLAKAIFSAFGGKIVTKFISDLTSKFKEGISYIKNQFFSLQTYIDDVNAGEQLMRQLSEASADLATNLGVSTQNAKELTTQAGKVSRELGMLPEELAAGIGELNKSFGTTQKFSDDTVKTFGQLTNLYGLTNEEASEFVKLSQLSGEEASTTALTYKTQIQALKERNNIAISEKEVMAEIAKSSAAIQLSSRGQGKNLADAAFQAKAMGLSLAQVESIGSNLLDFESSIASEMEAELLLGRDLNLEKARSAALNNDLATVGKEIASQIGSAAEFTNMTSIEQEALAKAVGMTRDELANTLKTQELLAGTGFNEMSDAQAAFNKLLKETGSEEKALAALKARGASDELANQVRDVSYQEQRVQMERDLVVQQMKMAQSANKFFLALEKVNIKIKEIKEVIVKQMKPFFNAFGGLVEDGGDAFKTMVLPYAERLGKFMNDVGLRIIDIVKNSGPALKNIFEGVLELFSSIYKVVGGVVSRLLGVEKTGMSAGSTFESIANFLSSMVDKLENVNIDALTEKIKTFMQGVKDTFISIKEGIMQAIDFVKNSALGQFLSGDTGKASLAIAPIAFKGVKMGKDAFDGVKGLLGMKKGEKASNPLFVQDVGGGGGSDMMSNLMRSGGRQAGIGGGFKKGWKGLFDYAKMALKPGRAGKVGRARIARAAKGLVTGQGASFVGGTGPGSAQAAGQLGRVGNIGKTLGKLAKGGVVFAAAGMAAEAAFGHFAKKSKEAANAMDGQIAVMEEGQAKEDAIQAQKDKLAKAESLAAAGTVASYTAMGAGIGSMIPVVGTAVGAVVGFTAGVVKAQFDYAKSQKKLKSANFAFEKKMQRNLLLVQKKTSEMELRAAAVKVKAAKEAAEKEESIRLDFAKKLGATGNTTAEVLSSLGELDIDYTSDAFRQLATDALDAGHITETQFTEALKGTLKPIDLMNAAATGAAESVTKLYDAALSAAEALGKEVEEETYEDLGINKDLLAAQKGSVEALLANAANISKDLNTRFTDALNKAVDSDMQNVLEGNDEDSRGFRADLIEQFTSMGIDRKDVTDAMTRLNDQIEQGEIEDFDLEGASQIQDFTKLLGNEITRGYESIEAEVNAKVAGVKANVQKELVDSGLIDELTQLKKSDLVGDEANQEIVTLLQQVLGQEQFEKVAADGITTEELDKVKGAIISEAARAAGGLESANKNIISDFTNALKPQQNAIEGAMVEFGNITAEFSSIIGDAATMYSDTFIDPIQTNFDQFSQPQTLSLENAESLDDFILRPGSAPLKFNEGDLLIGGTELSKALGIENPMESAMGMFGNITSKISSISPSLPDMDSVKNKVEPITEKIDSLVDSFFKKEEGKTEVETQSTEDLKVELQEMKQLMATFIQQMGQVVNRPITVELNGNKVGQALGQDSYRMQ